MKSHEEEEAEKQALIAHLIGAATGIASELEPGWALRSDQPWMENGYIHLAHPDGRGICFYVSVYHFDGKVSITGDYNFGPGEFGINWPYGKSRPDITCALSRGAVAIAKDITRRFLPVYNEWFAEITARVKMYTEDKARKIGIAERLGKIAGAKENRVSENGFSTYHNYGPYVDVKIYGDVEITIRSLSEGQAVKVLELLNRFEKGAAE